MWSVKLRALLGLSIVSSLSSACGSAAPAPETPHEPSAESPPKARPSKLKAERKTDRKVSNYPEPFIEPDCATVEADGHWPGGKKKLEAILSETRKQHWDELQACADAVPEGESVSVEVTTQFRLDADGVPRCVQALGATPRTEEVARCVLAVYRSFRFPSPNGPLRVTDGIRIEVSHQSEGEY